MFVYRMPVISINDRGVLVVRSFNIIRFFSSSICLIYLLVWIFKFLYFISVFSSIFSFSISYCHYKSNKVINEFASCSCLFCCCSFLFSYNWHKLSICCKIRVSIYQLNYCANIWAHIIEIARKSNKKIN